MKYLVVVSYYFWKTLKRFRLAIFWLLLVCIINKIVNCKKKTNVVGHVFNLVRDPPSAYDCPKLHHWFHMSVCVLCSSGQVNDSKFSLFQAIVICFSISGDSDMFLYFRR